MRKYSENFRMYEINAVILQMSCKRAQNRTCSGYAECSRHYEIAEPQPILLKAPQLALNASLCKNTRADAPGIAVYTTT